jgi:serine O-acetyltransferase
MIHCFVAYLQYGRAVITTREELRSYPVIGNGVWIYPLAMVLGVDVGDRACIPAGVVVTRPVPDDAVVAGVPARIATLDRPAHAAVDV